jgi:putative ABC transport system permease protein
MDSFVADFRYALRSLRLSPSYAIIAILCLALGIGTNTTVYSAVNAMILRPLAFAQPDRMIAIYETNAKLGISENSLSAAMIADIAAGARSIDGIAGYSDVDYAVGGRDDTEPSLRMQGELVSWDLFSLLGIQPVLGRGFTKDESVFGRHRVAIISDRIWHETYNADPRILDKSILLDGVPHTVIGVMPVGMRFPDTRDVWTPIAYETMPSHDARAFEVIARLRPDATVEQANAEVAAIASRVAKENPGTNDGGSARAMPYRDALVDEYRGLLWTMLGAVSFVLLIACGNVANLMLARATARQREIAVRVALGASRMRIVRQLITEAIIVATAGGVLGIFIAVWGLDALVKAIPYELPYWMKFDIDWRVLAYTFAVSVGTGCLFGMAPAVKSTSPDLNETLKDGSRGTTAGARHQRLRGALVIGETALCLVLLIGATLMMRSFVRMQTVQPGFRTHGVLTSIVMLPNSRYPDKAKRSQFFNDLQQRAASIPGVTAAAITNYSPLNGSNTGTNYAVDGQQAPDGTEPFAEFRAVSGAYFATLGIAMRQGRSFTAAEDADTAATVAVVNESFAARHFPKASPLGRRVRWGWTNQWLTIVGVAPDVKQRNLKDQPAAQIYIPVSLYGRRAMTVLLHTNGDPTTLAAGLRGAVNAIDPIVPIYETMSLESLRRRSMWESRVFGAMFAAFGIVALLLAAIGLYGVISYGVAQRVHELGVRMALGAQTRDVLRLVVTQGSRLALTGVIVGLPLAFVVTRALRSQLYSVTTSDPVTYVGICVLLAGIALIASYIPARRAARVDPMVALRQG